MKCFYHSADLDGHCSGALVKHRFPGCEMYPIDYGDEFPWSKIMEDEEIYMVDFCLQPWILMQRLVNNYRLVWIDHHKSAIEEWAKSKVWLGTQILDSSKAACELTWEYLFPDKPVPLAVKLLSLYDSWTYQGHELEPMVLPFQMRMRIVDLDPKNWDGCKSLWEQLWNGLYDPGTGESLIDVLVKDGSLLLRYDDEQKRRYVRTYAFETWLHDPNWLDRLAIAVNLGHTNSKVFDSVWKRPCPKCEKDNTYPGYTETGDSCNVCKGDGFIEPYDLMIAFCRRKDKLWNVSLYSTKSDIDCGAIAKSFGGGGHKGAAGFQCEKLPFDY